MISILEKSGGDGSWGNQDLVEVGDIEYSPIEGIHQEGKLEKE